MTYKRTDRTLYASAPNLLLDKIAEANIMLASAKGKPGHAFWKGVVETMEFVYEYIQELERLPIAIRELRSANRYLADENEYLMKRLSEYEITRELIEQDRLVEVIKAIEARGKIVGEEIKKIANDARS
jgi:regulator of replication initiation timing